MRAARIVAARLDSLLGSKDAEPASYGLAEPGGVGQRVAVVPKDEFAASAHRSGAKTE